MKILLIRFWLNKSYILPQAYKYTGSFFTLWGLISIFSPMDGYLSEELSIGCKLMIGVLAVVLVYVLSAIIALIICFKSNKECVFSSNSQHSVYVHFGDILSSNVLGEDSSQRYNLVIPVNRCFDTIVDDNLISHRTLHGALMQHLYDTNTFTVEELNQAIQDSLPQGNVFSVLERNQKPEGNLRRFSVGTVAEVKKPNQDLTYFFLGLSKFNGNLQASTTKSEYVVAIQKLIEFCNARSQGYPVVMPVIGMGLSRMNTEIRSTIKYIVNSLRLNKDIINCDFHIIIWKGDKDKVSIKNL